MGFVSIITVSWSMLDTKPTSWFPWSRLYCVQDTRHLEMFKNVCDNVQGDMCITLGGYRHCLSLDVRQRGWGPIEIPLQITITVVCHLLQTYLGFFHFIIKHYHNSRHPLVPLVYQVRLCLSVWGVITDPEDIHMFPS